MMFSSTGVTGWARTMSNECGESRRAREISSWTLDALETPPALGSACRWQGAIADVLRDEPAPEETGATPYERAGCAPAPPPRHGPKPPARRTDPVNETPRRFVLPEAACTDVKPILARFAPRKPDHADAPRVQTPASKGAPSRPAVEAAIPVDPPGKPAPHAVVPTPPEEPCQRRASSRATAAMTAKSDPIGAAQPEEAAARPESIAARIESAFRSRIDGPSATRDLLEAAAAINRRTGASEARDLASEPPADLPPAPHRQASGAAPASSPTAAPASAPTSAPPAPPNEPAPLHPIGVATRATSPSPDMQINAAADVAGSVTRIAPPLGVPSPPPLVPQKIATPPAVGLAAPLTRLATLPEDPETQEEDLGALASQIQEILRREARRHGISL
ncbi:MAG: hypothetical protein R2729_19455 [Bryobacteraceae bacterium]